MDLPFLLNELSSDDYFRSQKAAWELVSVGKDAVDGLMDVLIRSEFGHARYRAAWALGKIKETTAIDCIGRSMLEDPDVTVREWCAAALESVGHISGAPYLVKAMRKDDHHDVRLRAAMALRGLKAGDALKELLSDDDPLVRGMAITGLAKLGRCDLLDELAPHITDVDTDVRRRTAQCLGDLCDSRSIDHLCLGLNDSSPEVREESLNSLRNIGGIRSCDITINSLGDSDPRVRLRAVTALGEIGHPNAIDPLLEVLFGEDEEEIRAWAAWSLGEIGEERAIESLFHAYRTCPPLVKEKARNSLIEVFGQEVD